MAGPAPPSRASAPVTAAGQLVHHGGHRVERPGGEPDRGDADGERKPGAGVGEVGDRLRLPLAAAAAEQPRDELARLVGGERADGDGDRAELRVEALQPGAPGHHDQAVYAARDQLDDLASVRRVVEHHQDAALGDEGAEQRGPAVLVRRDVAGARPRSPSSWNSARAGVAALHLGRPCRSRKMCSPKRAAFRCAQCSTSDVLPTPTMPWICTTVAGPRSPAAASASSSAASSRSRPTKSRAPRAAAGRAAARAGPPPGGRSCRGRRCRHGVHGVVEVRRRPLRREAPAPGEPRRAAAPCAVIERAVVERVGIECAVSRHGRVPPSPLS